VENFPKNTSSLANRTIYTSSKCRNKNLTNETCGGGDGGEK
jgi:hypothetical protein